MVETLTLTLKQEGVLAAESEGLLLVITICNLHSSTAGVVRQDRLSPEVFVSTICNAMHEPGMSLTWFWSGFLTNSSHVSTQEKLRMCELRLLFETKVRTESDSDHKWEAVMLC